MLRREEMRGWSSAEFFHVCTDGRVMPWMFQDEADFIAGVNRIGICCLKTKAKVVSFVLMDNHVHFVLLGTMSQCKEFITLYKQLTGTWIHNKYGLNDFLKQLPTTISRLDTEERLLNTIAYIDRNPIVAGYKYLATEYPWGSAQYLFKKVVANEPTRRLGTLTVRSKIKLLNTRTTLPDDWSINQNGMLTPQSFIDFSKTESYFKSPARYSYYLAKKLEGIVEKEYETAQKIFIPDSELREIVGKIISNEYGKNNLSDLDLNSRLSIAKKLRYNYASTIKQIARMLHLEKSTLEHFL